MFRVFCVYSLNEFVLFLTYASSAAFVHYRPRLSSHSLWSCFSQFDLMTFLIYDQATLLLFFKEGARSKTYWENNYWFSLVSTSTEFVILFVILQRYTKALLSFGYKLSWVGTYRNHQFKPQYYYRQYNYHPGKTTKWALIPVQYISGTVVDVIRTKYDFSHKFCFTGKISIKQMTLS